jgi:cyclophilin family peptidyl-prolyl cis-trans isomerase
VNGGSSFFVELRRENAPNGVDRFFDLVQRHFYDHNAFFRVVPGFVVQVGERANVAAAAAVC